MKKILLTLLTGLALVGQNVIGMNNENITEISTNTNSVDYTTVPTIGSGWDANGQRILIVNQLPPQSPEFTASAPKEEKSKSNWDWIKNFGKVGMYASECYLLNRLTKTLLEHSASNLRLGVNSMLSIRDFKMAPRAFGESATFALGATLALYWHFKTGYQAFESAQELVHNYFSNKK